MVEAQMNEPPDERLWHLMRGAMTTKALSLVADLGVADALADGQHPVAEIASQVGADADTLHRVLRALSSDGVFAEEQPGVFRNTELSQLLRGPDWRASAHLLGGVWHRAMGELDASGNASFPRTFGTDFWGWLAAHPAERGAFDRAMAGGKDESADRLMAAEWRDGDVVVDVGGGNGALLVELLRRRPGLRGIAFDLPETDRDESAFGDAIEFAAGSFFDEVPGGDVYVLSEILHNWPDEPAAAILRTIRAAAPPHARLLILDSVIGTGNDPHSAKWLDLLMLALFGSRERDRAQWTALLVATGWEPSRIDDGLIQARCRDSRRPAGPEWQP
jgi:O-methyltransferase domain/Dimerisation domain